MTASNDIGKRAEEIQLNIASDNIPQAIKLLLDFVKDFSEDKDNINEVIVLSSSYNRLDKAERRGTLPFDQIEQKRNQLLYQILGLIDSIENTLALQLAA